MSGPSNYVPGPQNLPYAPQRPAGPWQAQGAPPQAPNGTQMMASPPAGAWGAAPPPAPHGATPWQGHGPSPGYAPAAPGYAPAAPSYAPSPQGYAPAPGYAPSPQGYAPSPQGYAPAPQGHAVAPQAPPHSPQGHAPAPPGYAPGPQGHAPPWAGHAPPANQAGAWQGNAYAAPGAQPGANPVGPHAPAPQPPQHPAGYANAGAAARPAAPGCAHSYPLAVRQAGLIVATKLTFKTLPYALFRFAYASLFAAAGALQLCAIAGLAFVLSTYVHAAAGAVVVLAGLLAWALLWLPFVEHKMFATWCGHVAILTELITKGQVGNGRQGMFAFGRELAATRLGDLETVWSVYRTINKNLRRVSNLLNFADDLLPIDLGPVKRLMHRAVGWVAPYVEGVIVSYGLARGDRDFKAAGADGLGYSVQNAKALFKTAFGVLLLEQVALLPAWVGSLALFVPGLFYATYAAMGGDAGALLDGNAAALQRDVLPLAAAAAVGVFVGGAFALLTVKTVKEAFVKPTLLTMVMVKFHVAIENQPLDQNVMARASGAGEGLARLDGARAMLRRAGV